jgi:hypothetical protein
MLFTYQNTPHITFGNEQCLKLLLGICNTKKSGDLSGSSYTSFLAPSYQSVFLNSLAGSSVSESGPAWIPG